MSMTRVERYVRELNQKLISGSHYYRMVDDINESTLFLDKKSKVKTYKRKNTSSSSDQPPSKIPDMMELSSSYSSSAGTSSLFSMNKPKSASATEITDDFLPSSPTDVTFPTTSRNDENPTSAIVDLPTKSQNEEILSMLRTLNNKMDDIKSYLIQSNTMVSNDLPLASENDFEKFSNPIFRENIFGYFKRTITGPNWKIIIYSLLDQMFSEELQRRLLWPSRM